MQSISISLLAFPNTIALLWGDSSTEQYQVRSSTRSARGAQRRGRKIRPVRPKQSPCSADVRTERAGDTPSLIQHSTTRLHCPPSPCELYHAFQLWSLTAQAAQQLPRCLPPAALEGVTRLQALDHCLRTTAGSCFRPSYLHPLVSCSR
jgi:hypothetical protein